MATDFFIKDFSSSRGLGKRLGTRYGAGIHCADCGFPLRELIRLKKDVGICPICGSYSTKYEMGFVWMVNPVRLGVIIKETLKRSFDMFSDKVIKDEYGTEFTLSEFLKEVSRCRYHELGIE